MSPLIQISRPVNVAITMATIVVAAQISGPLEPLSAVMIAALSGGLIAAASNTINDVYDIEIDRINKPHRPLPAGRIPSNTARNAAYAEYLLGNLLAILISPAMMAVALLFSALTFLYAARFKRTVLWGNMVVSLSSAAAFYYGGLAINQPNRALLPALFAFLFHLGREIIKDLEDMKGDQQDGAVTFPIRYGKKPAIQLTRLIFITLIIATILPFYMNWYGSAYFIVIVLGVIPIIAYTLLKLRKQSSTETLGFLSNLLKADMLIGLLAVYLG